MDRHAHARRSGARGLALVRVDLKLAPQFTTVDELRSVWSLAEDAGFDGCWVFDHFASLGGTTDGPVFEGWTLLAAMAQFTRRVRIGVMVTGVTYRHPAVLAKMAVTVDRLSNGRLEMGMGAAWAVAEHEMLGLPFPAHGPRIASLDEACAVMKALWTEPRASFKGRHFTLREAIAEPKPLQRPHPPLWIGGSGERKLLRVVARHADVWNHTSSDPEHSARLARVLDEHCVSVERDPASVARSVQFFYRGDPEAFVKLARGFVAAGFPLLVCGVTSVDDGRRVAELLPRLREL